MKVQAHIFVFLLFMLGFTREDWNMFQQPNLTVVAMTNLKPGSRNAATKGWTDNFVSTLLLAS